jgi:hypothetical protein
MRSDGAEEEEEKILDCSTAKRELGKGNMQVDAKPGQRSLLGRR